MTLDKILKGFNKTLTQLEQLRSEKTQAIRSNTERIDELRQQNEEAVTELDRATKVEGNLRALLEG